MILVQDEEEIDKNELNENSMLGDESNIYS